MFRKPSGKVGFSFNRLVTNAIPNLANDSASDVDLSPKQQDDLFKFQLSQPDPRVLNEQSFFVVGIVDTMSQSPKIHASLQKASILSSHPDDPTVYTSRITKQFAHQFAIISVHKQRKLVGMLFFWEEELKRWQMLEDEEKEIGHVLKGFEESGDTSQAEELRIVLGQIQVQRRMEPSLRESDGNGVTGNEEHVLPEYGQRDGTVAVPGREHGHEASTPSDP